MDARINVLWASAPSTILPDTTYYAEDHPQREELLTLWKESSANLLKAYDFSDAEIEDLLEKRLELDRRVAAVVLSNEESSEYAKLYHHMLTKISRNLRLPYLWMTSPSRSWTSARQGYRRRGTFLASSRAILQ